MFLVCEYKPPVMAFAEFTNLLLWKLRLLNVNNNAINSNNKKNRKYLNF
jgi:hypothetical protein